MTQTSSPLIVTTVAGLRAQIRDWRAQGARIGLVTTMGALHEGHLSLAARARAECDRVITTIFVNPTQFNNADDLDKYPRTLDADAALLATVPVDVIFAPSPAEVYPAGFGTTIAVADIGEPLEGAMRPGHFDGVAQVVAKLFNMTTPDRAYFGQKDWQQLQLILKLGRDLNFPIEIIGCETVRETDGLAKSSRNTRLSAVARTKAPALYAAMTAAAQAIQAGVAAETALTEAKSATLAGGYDEIEYIELCDATTLLPLTDPNAPKRMLAAAWLDGVRLIDNIPV